MENILFAGHSPSLLEDIPDGVIITDSATRVRYANKRARRILRLPAGILATEPLHERVHPEDRPKVKQYAEVLQVKKQTLTKRRFLRGDGRYVFLERNTTLLPDGTQLSICRDISLLEERRRKQEALVSIAAHDLRDPLSLIKVYADLLRLECVKSGGSQEALSLLEHMDAHIDRQNRMIDDFLDISRVKKGKLVFRMGSVDVKQLVSEVASHLRHVTKRNFVVSTDGSMSRVVSGDKDRLYQVFTNLLNNAVKFSPVSTPIEIMIKNDPSHVIVSITDHGVGIKKEEQNRIFESFYQAGTSRGTGLGLGLFLSLEIIKYHQGTLSVESADGKGSSFIVTLPRVSPYAGS